MVDGSGPLVANIVLLVHLGQLKISYGPDQIQESISLTGNIAHGVDNFSECFFFICLVMKECMTWLRAFSLSMYNTVYK